MQFDSYRWQDHVQSRHRRSVDLALSGVFAVGLMAGAALQFADSHGFAPAAGRAPLPPNNAKTQAAASAFRPASSPRLRANSPPAPSSP